MSAGGIVGENTRWVASLSPWPEDGFGLERMHALLHELGNPQQAYPAIHVVGTNGKSTATRRIEALLLVDGLSVGATVSPHVGSWSERIRVDGEEVDFEEAIGSVRAAAEHVGATQFETITAAALAAFAAAHVAVAVVEAGLGGRLDATNVLRTRVVLLTNVALEHTDVLGETTEEIAKEKLAVAHAGSIVVLQDNRYAHLVPDRRIVHGKALEAAQAFVGHTLTDHAEVSLPGRLERRPGEVRDGAHTPDAVRWLAERLPRAEYTICASILRDKDVTGILSELAKLGNTFVATQSTNARAIPAASLGELARSHFPQVEVVLDPVAAVARAHVLGEPALVTGSLYLLADLAAAEAQAGLSRP